MVNQKGFSVLSPPQRNDAVVALAKRSRKVVRMPQLPAFIFSAAHQTNLTECVRVSETRPLYAENGMGRRKRFSRRPHRVCNISINTLSARAIKPPHSVSQPSILVRRWVGGWLNGWWPPFCLPPSECVARSSLLKSTVSVCLSLCDDRKRKTQSGAPTACFLSIRRHLTSCFSERKIKIG